MTTALSLKQRAPLINAAALLASVEKKTNDQVRVVRVPGHEGPNVVFVWNRGRYVEFECQRDTGHGLIPCPAYEHGKVCYHGMAAAKVAAREAGCRVVGWAESPEAANQLANLAQYRGCRVGYLMPKGGGEKVWFFWKREK